MKRHYRVTFILTGGLCAWYWVTDSGCMKYRCTTRPGFPVSYVWTSQSDSAILTA